MLIKLDKNQSINIGKLGEVFFKKGFYVYIGSALNSLEKRIERHLRKDKKFHWHIDYFLKYAKVVDVFYRENDRSEECRFAGRLIGEFEPVVGFGCSDCSCKSHLFYGDKRRILRLLNLLEMENFDN